MNERKISRAMIGMVMLFFAVPSEAWNITESFDNQSVGQDCGTFWKDNADSTVTNIKSSSGSNSCRFAVAPGGTAWGGGFVFPQKVRMKKGEEGWVRFRLFIPQGFNYNSTSAGNHLKFIRWATNNSGGGNAGYEDWYWEQDGVVPPFKVIREFDSTCGGNCWQKFGTANDKPQRGVWETYEMYVKFDNVPVDQGGTGRVRAWKNGVLLSDMTSRPTLPNATDTVGGILIFSYWNGGAPAKQEMYFDDLVATNVRPSARDSHGNPYIGVGQFVSIAPPLPPSSIN